MDADHAAAPHPTREVAGRTGEHHADGSGATLESVARAALLDAIVTEVAEVGYEAASVASICRRSAVAQTLYCELFADKQACFLAACRAFADEILARVSAASEGVRDWERGVRAGLDAFLTYLADHPSAAHALLIEGLAAGPEALAIRDIAMRAFAGFLDTFPERDGEVRDRAALVSEASVGGIYGIVTRRIRDGKTSTLPELSSSLSYFLLAPVVGCPRARLELSTSAT